MAFNYDATAKTLLDKLGGPANINSMSHCMTRLRFTLKDNKRPIDDEVEKIPGILRVIRQGGQYQVVIGNEVTHLYNALSKLGTFAETAQVDNTEPEGNLFSRFCGFIAGCMTPLLPAMLGCGMIRVVLILLSTLGLVSADSSTYLILDTLGDSFFYFMPIMLGYTTARKLGANPYLAMVMGAFLIHPNLVGLFAGGNTSLFGLPVTAATYSSSVIPILMMVPIMKYIEIYVDRFTHDLLKIFVVPMVVLFISLPIALVVVGPIGTIIGDYLAIGVNFLFDRMGWLTITLLSAFMPFIVMTGMHYALVPIAVTGLATFGYDSVLIITMFCSNVAQGASSLAVAARTKDKEIRTVSMASSISAVIAGITEPAMYGVTLKYRFPMIGAICGAGAAGLYAGITSLKAFAMGGSPSVLSLIQMIGEDGANFINGCITLLISVCVSFAVTFILYKKDIENQDAVESLMHAPETSPKPLVERIDITSPMTGSVLPLAGVQDEAFSSGTLGDGIALLPTEGKVYAPEDGTVTALVDTNHAIGFVTDAGVEVLIHIGLNTVKLAGEHFKAHCQTGDKVKKGDLLLEFDMEAIKAAGYDIITPIIISNTGKYISVKGTGDTTITRGETLLTIV